MDDNSTHGGALVQQDGFYLVHAATVGGDGTVDVMNRALDLKRITRPFEVVRHRGADPAQHAAGRTPPAVGPPPRAHHPIRHAPA